MQHFWFHVFVMSVAAAAYLFGAWSVLRDRRGSAGTVAFALAVGVATVFAEGLSFGTTAFVLFWQCLFNLPLLLLGRKLQWSSRTILFGSAAVLLVTTVMVFSGRYLRVRSYARMREQNAFQSLADRLSYEQRAPQKISMDSASLAPETLPKEVDARLSRFDEERSYNGRMQSLKNLHDQTRDRFEMEEGFGVRRMKGFGSVALYDPGPIRMAPPSVVSDTSESVADKVYGKLEKPSHKPDQDKLLQVHAAGLDDFLDSDRMGYFLSRDRVAGFVSHQFATFPAYTAKFPATPWGVTRIELISLLKHAEPVAYVSEHLPRMDELSRVATRPLIPFEKSALSRLRRDADIVVDERPNLIRMLGSIRAGNACLQCHAVRRGELLGAFAYEIMPDEQSTTDSPRVR